MDIDHLRALLSGERVEPIAVAAIHNPALAEVIGAADRHAVLLSRDTIVKEKVRHPDIDFEQYCVLPDVVRFGLVVQEYSQQLVFCYEHHSGRRYRAMVKATLAGHELYVTSFHRMRDRQTKAILKRGLILRRHA